MRKILRAKLRFSAYKQHGGIGLFKYLWKKDRVKKGYEFVEDKPVKRKSALQRLIGKRKKMGAK